MSGAESDTSERLPYRFVESRMQVIRPEQATAVASTTSSPNVVARDARGRSPRDCDHHRRGEG